MLAVLVALVVSLALLVGRFSRFGLSGGRLLHSRIQGFLIMWSRALRPMPPTWANSLTTAGCWHLWPQIKPAGICGRAVVVGRASARRGTRIAAADGMILNFYIARRFLKIFLEVFFMPI